MQNYKSDNMNNWFADDDDIRDYWEEIADCAGYYPE